MTYLKSIKTVHIVMIIFFFINLFFLCNFPFVHSDEAWLSGLSRTILQEKDLSVTEPFFDLYPRHPHAIKILFHLIQIIFIKLLGYQIFSFRLISLLAGTAALFPFYKIVKKFTESETISLLALIIMAVDIQFVYASHFARQEILLVLFLLSALYYFLDKYKMTIYGDITLGIILGTSIGIHPNSFVITFPFVLIYLYILFIKKKIKIINFITFIATLGIIALFFVDLSCHFNPNFIKDYTSYGESLGVSSSIFTKIDRLVYFYQKLFYEISGTYYTPDIKFQFIIFSIAIVYAVIQIFLNKLLYNYNQNKLPFVRNILKYKFLNTENYLQIMKENNSLYIKKIDILDININLLLLIILLGINMAYVLIGRYNQTSIIFIFPISYLLIFNIISSIKKNYTYIIILLLVLVLTFNTGISLVKDTNYNYDKYLKEIAMIVDKDNRVLANLNSEYYFNNDRLLDYRNLAYLDENKISFSEYIKSHKIEYIIYPEEMDFIFNSRPVWNILYGNLYPYYQDMKEFLMKECKPVHNFTNKTYGMRIVRYIGKRNWKIRIYKVNPK